MIKPVPKRYPPKGSYPHPSGGFVVDHVSPSTHSRGKRLKFTVVHRPEPGLAAIATVLLDMAKQQANDETTRARV